MQIASANKYRDNAFYLLALLVILVIAYWPISLYVYSVKNDALNYFLPVRRLVSESFNHHALPLWSPYLNLGYPLNGDMQSGVWNPVVQLLSLFGPYTLFTLHIETLLYIFLSGAGMFYLLKYFDVHPYANMVACVAYMLCGFNSDCCQFPNWIAGTAFLPFLFLFYYRFLFERSARMAVCAGLMMFLLFTCAYPADFIIAGYLLAGMFAWHFINLFRRTKKNPFNARILFLHVLLLLVFLALSAPAIISYLQSLPFTERGKGASYADAMSNPLHPFLVGAYTTPLAVWKMPQVGVTDALERNSYFGIVGLMLACCSFFFPTRSAIIRFCRWAAIIFFIFSLGEWGGLRVISYYFLPMMNTFRHPANAKMFTIFFSCMLASFVFDARMKNEIDPKPLRIAFIGVCTFAMLVLLWSCISSPLYSLKSIEPNHAVSLGQWIKDQINDINFARIVLLNMLIQIPFLYFSWRWMIKKFQPRAVMLLAISNSILFCMLVQPFTVVKNEKASTIGKLVEANAVNDYPLPDLTKSIAQNSADGMKYFKAIGVLNLYNKKPGRVDYRITPSNLLSQNEFWADTVLRRATLDHPLLYCTNTSVNPEMRVLQFDPNDFQFSVKNDAPADFVLLQNYFPCWELVIDGKKTSPEKVNRSFMGFSLPAGRHLVSFHYSVPGLIVMCRISFLSLLLVILYLLISRKNKPMLKHLFYALGATPLLDRLIYTFTRLKYSGKNARFRKNHPGVNIPADYFLYETFRLDYEEYFNDGNTTAKQMATYFSKYKNRLPLTVLEWGCGVGRIIQHLPVYLPANAHISGCDINSKMIDWDSRNIQGIEFSLIQKPFQTDYPQDSFDFIYAISVMTHVNATDQENWLKEMHRISNKEGIFLFTTHGNAYFQQLLSSEQKKLRQNGYYTKASGKEGHRLTTTYNVPGNIRQLISQYFDIVEYIDGKISPDSMGGQDIWIVKKV